MKQFPYLILLCLLMSCKPELLDINEVNVELSNPEFAIPLINTSISIQDALDEFDSEGFLDVDSDNFMTLYYTGEVGSLPGVDIPELADFELPVIDTLINFPFSIIQSDIDFDIADVTAGSLEISFTSDYTEDLTVIVTVANFSKNGLIVSEVIPVQFDNTGTQNVVRTLDLSNSKFDLENDQIEISYSCRNSLNQHRALTDLKASFTGIKLDYLQGYVGEFDLSIPVDTVTFDLFSDVIGGNLIFENPSIEITLNNGFGVPMRMSANSMTVLNENNESMPFMTDLDNGILLNFPNLNEVGETKTTTLLLDQTNSNLTDVISFNPKKLVYSLEASANPEQDSTFEGFVSSESLITASVEAKLPLWLRANNFVLEETVTFDFESLEEIEQAEFKLITENGLPIELNIQAYFLDSLII